MVANNNMSYVTLVKIDTANIALCVCLMVCKLCYGCVPQRPFSIDRHMTNEEIVSNIRHTRPSASVRWDHQTCDLLRMVSEAPYN